MGFDNEQLGFNALHHSVQSYADSTSAVNENAVKPCHPESIETILCTQWGKDACLQQTRDGLYTPLHLCCRSIVPDDITRAIASANPAAISMQDEEGDTPLHSAFRYGASEDIIHILIELAYSYSQDGDECTFAKLNDDGEISLHTAISHEASGRSVKLLLDAHPQGILAYNGRLQSPLHVACETGRYDIIDVILQSHASIDSVESLLKVRDERGLAPIFILWTQVCTMNKCPNSESESESLLEILVCIARLLKSTEFFESTNIDCKDSTSIAYQLLRTAICLGSNTVPGGYVAFLVKYNPGILCQADSNGLLPLHLATTKYHHSSHNDSVGRNSYKHFLHEYCPIDVKAVCDDVLEQRYENDDALFINIILNANNSAVFARDKAGKLPLHLAIDAGVSWTGMKKLIQVNPLAIKDEDPATGLLPFMSAAKRKTCEKFDRSRNCVDAIFRLLRSSPDAILPTLEKSDKYCTLESPPSKRRRIR